MVKLPKLFLTLTNISALFHSLFLYFHHFEKCVTVFRIWRRFYRKQIFGKMLNDLNWIKNFIYLLFETISSDNSNNDAKENTKYNRNPLKTWKIPLISVKFVARSEQIIQKGEEINLLHECNSAVRCSFPNARLFSISIVRMRFLYVFCFYPLLLVFLLLNVRLLCLVQRAKRESSSRSRNVYHV